MHHPLHLRLKTITAACLLGLAVPMPSAQADDVDNLIETILDSSPSARAGAESYAAQAAKRTPPPQKTPKKKEPKPAAPKPTIPVLQIPEEDLLEVSSKFPKNFIGKYIYGPVTLHDFQLFDHDGIAYVGFTAKNWRGFYLDTRDPRVIEKFSQLKRGMRFDIPREFPLRIVGKPGLNYILNLPFENLQN